MGKRKKSQAEKVRRWLARNPDASNASLYSAFPKLPRPSLRRIAQSVPKVRSKRGLPPLAADPSLLKGAKTAESERFFRKQIAYSRELHFTKLGVPLSADAEHALKSVFAEAEDFAKAKGLDIKLSTYHMVVQVARSGKLGKGNKLNIRWSRQEFITIADPTGLKRVKPRQLWTAFEDFALQKINNLERGLALVNASIVASSKSDPVFIRPAKLTIYMHGPEGG